MVGGAGGGLVTVKLLALAAVPPAVVTPMGPVPAPEGTVAWITVGELTVYVVAVTELNVTELAPVKFVPLIWTLVPTGPLVGAKSLIVGGAGGGLVTVKLLALVAVPPPVVTPMGPVPAPEGTVAWITVGELTVYVVAVTELNVTELAPLKFVPLIWTFVPTGPLVGAKPLIVGGAGGGLVTVKLLALVAVPPPVVTPIGPVVAPEGTVAWITVGELTVYVVAATEPKVTELAPLKLVPFIWTLVPAGPLVGAKLLMVGGGMAGVVALAMFE